MSQDKVTKIVKEINTLKTSCEKLNAQLEELITQKVENEILLEEVKNLEDDAVLHKLVGLILVREEKNKCYDTITRRIHYITGEMLERLAASPHAELCPPVYLCRVECRSESRENCRSNYRSNCCSNCRLTSQANAAYPPLQRKQEEGHQQLRGETEEAL
ncbi:prefoldin beta subunit [Plasmodium inui San Antonio 1]|uniref:Prefoldin beta subunit n=1 Tax=Plasmodium inui San Antonio 1 TaxID=1237626 RepID=W7A562_9APIC|nr:prefoldin beta subunit [Plasmodium inui San Antonio 1]EUD68242.1 prefoldin beta subunit [Plasmodium inui San Antonio 1]